MSPPTNDPTAIPIVDFAPFLHGPADQQKAVATQIDEAFRGAGFVYLRNHGVAAEVVGEAFEWSKKFFALPPATKLLAPHPPGHSHHRGYSSPGLEKVSQHTYDADSLATLRSIPDYKESFESGNPLDTAQPNIWPPDSVLPGFRAFQEKYFALCTALLHRILDALALALNLDDPQMLSRAHSDSLFQLRLLHYPSLPAADLQDNRRARINAHSDFGTLTLLFQDDVGGLEIEDLQSPGQFSGVQPVEGAVLVNIGDLMARWSNERWRSTVHRVGLPLGFGDKSGEGGGEGVVVPARYSIPVFATANMEAVIEALPGCWDENRPKKFESVTAWGYVQMRMAALYE